MNFHLAVALLRELSNDGSSDSADRTFPAESITRSNNKPESGSVSSCPSETWRPIKMGAGRMIPDALSSTGRPAHFIPGCTVRRVLASKISARFSTPEETFVDTPST